jgi:hypothetical protein
MASILMAAKTFTFPTAIETGDDAVVFYSSSWGPARFENITVTNPAVVGISTVKFCDGNQNCIREITIDNS